MADGLFARHGLRVRIAEHAGGPLNVVRVAEGGAHFCLTDVHHYLAARAARPGLAARFVAVIVRRSPLSAVVAASSPIAVPADLPGRRLGAPEGSWYLAEFLAGLARLGVAPPQVVPMDQRCARAALAGGEVEAILGYADAIPGTRRRTGIEVRAVPLHTPVYTTGLVAGDRLGTGAVQRMRDAVVAALENQRRNHAAGLAEMLRLYPKIDPAHALEGWALSEPYIFDGNPPGSMAPEGWDATIEFHVRVHGAEEVEPDTRIPTRDGGGRSVTPVPLVERTPRFGSIMGSAALRSPVGT